MILVVGLGLSMIRKIVSFCWWESLVKLGLIMVGKRWKD